MIETRPKSDARLALALPRPLHKELVRQARRAEVSVSEVARQLLVAGLRVQGRAASGGEPAGSAGAP